MSDSPALRPVPARCTGCGAVLAAAVDDDGVVTVGDLQVMFRRHTDHVVCSRCLASYRVTDLKTDRAPA